MSIEQDGTEPDIVTRFRQSFEETREARPRISRWRCRAFGQTWYPFEGEVPNAFRRFMQWLLFGAEWKKR